VSIAFDTLKFVEKLEAGGFSSAQARAAPEAFAGATGEQLAKKADLTALAAGTKADLAALGSDLRQTELRLEGKIEATKFEILKWMFGQTLLILGAVIALGRPGH
jgi:hypothetical protein